MTGATSIPHGTPSEAIWLRPWCWMLVALGATTAALAWARLCGDDQMPMAVGQVPLVILGVLAAGISDFSDAFAQPPASVNSLDRDGGALQALALTHLGAALAVSAVCVVKLGRPDLPGDFNGTIVLWLVVAPWCAFAAWRLHQTARADLPLEPQWETAVLVSLAGLTAFMASWALYWGPEARDAWDTQRLFFGVLAVFAFIAAPLTAAPVSVRRLGVSALILLHFFAVGSVVLGATPGPWVALQAQHWIFRPYLEFMYLNNAYRFYSPEPSPASQLWFCIDYDDGGKQPIQRWVKLPDMDDSGNHKYPLSLQLTRRLSLTENVARTDPMPQMLIRDRLGNTKLAPFAERRDAHSPTPMGKDLMGFKQSKATLIVPLHPDPSVPNYLMPNASGRLLLSSYARHLLREPWPEKPNAKPVSVRIYRVQHRILLAENLAMGADPLDWIFYLPYYQGRYDKEGAALLDPDDPFLFWCLPILRENPDDPKSRVFCYVFKHAGDERNWIRPAR